ncbi:MAG: MFS transporter [bacterium]
MDQLKTANRNIKLYIFVRIFAKRVFLPLTALYFIDTAGFTIRDIGLLSAFFSIIQLVTEVPTGYFADRIGRLASIRVGAALAAIATTIYVFIHHKTGIYLGVMLEALGYSFLGGAGEALIHDSLVIKKQELEYARYMSRTMSISLIANAILIAFVSMTYAWNPTYPFALGTLAYLLLFTTALFMHDVKHVTSVVKFKIPVLKQIVGKKNLLLFGLSFGIIAALYTSPADMFNVALHEYGIRIDLIGWIYGLASIVGACMGPFVHYLRHMRLSRYLLIDIVLVTSVYLAAYTGSPYFLGAMMILGIGFWRYRRIIYQSYLLQLYPTSYKATLISTMNNLEQLNAIWLPLLITGAIYHTSTSTGLGLIGLFTLLVAPIFYYSTLKFFRQI